MLIFIRILWIILGLTTLNYFTLSPEYFQQSAIVHGLALLFIMLAITFIYAYYIYKACSMRFANTALKYCWIALVIFLAPIGSIIFHIVVLEIGKGVTAHPSQKEAEPG